MIYAIYNKSGEKINEIVADENFCKSYCKKHGYTYELVEVEEPEPMPEEEPTQIDVIEAQVYYTAMMTDTLLEE